jgi:hypothetical protein
VFVSAKVAGVDAPEVVAVTLYVPVVPLAVQVTLASPLASVVALVAESTQLAPVCAGAEKVTVASLVAVPLVFTFATSALGNAVLMTVLCGVDVDAAVMVTVEAAVFVRANVAGVVAPETVAVTLYEPAVPFAVQVTEDTLPLASVVAEVAEREQVAPPEDDPAEYVTVTPLSADPLEVTVTPSGFGNGVPTSVLCGVSPLAAVIKMVGGGGVDFELLQPIRKPKVRHTRTTRTLA